MIFIVAVDGGGARLPNCLESRCTAARATQFVEKELLFFGEKVTTSHLTTPSSHLKYFSFGFYSDKYHLLYSFLIAISWLRNKKILWYLFCWWNYFCIIHWFRAVHLFPIFHPHFRLVIPLNRWTSKWQWTMSTMEIKEILTQCWSISVFTLLRSGIAHSQQLMRMKDKGYKGNKRTLWQG